MLWICRQCTTAYSVGADGCPHCGSTEYAEEGTDMAKISRHGGATNKTTGPATVELVVDGEPVDVTGHRLPDASDEEREAPGTGVAMEGVEAAPGGTEHELVVSPYDGMLRADLQELCRMRGLSAAGNKDEMIARLVAADDAKAEDDGELGTVPVDPA